MRAHVFTFAAIAISTLLSACAGTAHRHDRREDRRDDRQDYRYDRRYDRVDRRVERWN